MKTIDILNEVERVFEIKLPEEYKLFLISFNKLIKPIEFNAKLNNKEKLLCLEELNNIVTLIRGLAFRLNLQELLLKEIIFIGAFIGGESLCLGVGIKNFNKVYFSETDLNEFTLIYDDFEEFQRIILTDRLKNDYQVIE